LLAPTAVAVDRVLELVNGREVVCPVRCLGPDERSEILPASIRDFTLAERARQFCEQTLATARQAVGLSEQRCQRRRQDKPILEHLYELADRLVKVEKQAQAFRDQRDQIATELERLAHASDNSTDSGPHADFIVAIAASRRVYNETLAGLDRDEAEVRRRV